MECEPHGRIVGLSDVWPRRSNVETRFGADVPIEMCGIETDREAVDTAVHEVPSVMGTTPPNKGLLFGVVIQESPGSPM